MADIYNSMTELYNDLRNNREGEVYWKRWRRHEWSQTIEEQITDNIETQKIVMAIHGGGIEPGTSEIALAAAGYHPAALTPLIDGVGLHGCSSKGCCQKKRALARDSFPLRRSNSN